VCLRGPSRPEFCAKRAGWRWWRPCVRGLNNPGRERTIPYHLAGSFLPAGVVGCRRLSHRIQNPVSLARWHLAHCPAHSCPAWEFAGFTGRVATRAHNSGCQIGWRLPRFAGIVSICPKRGVLGALALGTRSRLGERMCPRQPTRAAPAVGRTREAVLCRTGGVWWSAPRRPGALSVLRKSSFGAPQAPRTGGRPTASPFDPQGLPRSSTGRTRRHVRIVQNIFDSGGRSSAVAFSAGGVTMVSRTVDPFAVSRRVRRSRVAAWPWHLEPGISRRRASRTRKLPQGDGVSKRFVPIGAVADAGRPEAVTLVQGAALLDPAAWGRSETMR
jgi:hypothetical protein